MKNTKPLLFIVLIIAFRSINFAQTDSTAVIDSSSTVPITKLSSDSTAVPKDTLKPLFQSELLTDFLSSNKYTRDQINFSDYRSINEILRNLPFSGLTQLGQLGQPSFSYIYGFNSNSTNFLSSGLLYNNKIANGFDAQSLQSESIEYIEMLPLARGFIYGSIPNIAALNFSSFDRLAAVPFSRIRFYQAPNNEASIDAIFSAYVTHRLNATIQVTNYSADSYYTNSEYGQWNASVKLHYFLSNKINIIGDVNYLYRNVNLFGGVNRDSIFAVLPANEAEDVFYSNVQAPVYYGNYTSRNVSSRYEKERKFNYSVKLLAELVENNREELSLYTSSDLRMFRQNEFGFAKKLPVIYDNNEAADLGIKFKHISNYGFFTLTGIGGFERNVFNSPLISIYKKMNIVYAAGILTLNPINNFFIPSGFIRHTVIEGENYFGAGADAILNLTENISLYGGLSSFQKPLSIYERQFTNLPTDGHNVYSLEVKANYNSERLKASLGFFTTKYNGSPEPYINKYADSLFINETGGYFLQDKLNSGLNLSVDYKIWKFELISNSTYFLHQGDNNNFDQPEFSSVGGIYYLDQAFKNALDFKMGINYYLYGKRNFATYDFERDLAVSYKTTTTNSTPQFLSSELIPSSFQIDFFFAGRIQEDAIAYFVYENILGAKYYQAAYYPMPGRGMRFGVSWEFFN